MVGSNDYYDIGALVSRESGPIYSVGDKLRDSGKAPQTREPVGKDIARNHLGRVVEVYSVDNPDKLLAQGLFDFGVSRGRHFEREEIKENVPGSGYHVVNNELSVMQIPVKSIRRSEGSNPGKLYIHNRGNAHLKGDKK